MEKLDIKDFPVTNEDIQEVLGYTYNAAYKIITGRRKLQPGTLNYLLLKMNLHPTEKLITK